MTEMADIKFAPAEEYKESFPQFVILYNNNNMPAPNCEVIGIPIYSQ